MQPEFEPVRQSFLMWIFSALGFQYTVLLPLAGLLSFALALLVVLRGRGPMAAVALLLIVHVPMLLGIFAAIDGLIISYTVIANSPTTPKPSEMATGYSMSLVAPMVGMVLMVPGYAVAVIGSIVNSLSFASQKATLQN